MVLQGWGKAGPTSRAFLLRVSFSFISLINGIVIRKRLSSINIMSITRKPFLGEEKSPKCRGRESMSLPLGLGNVTVFWHRYPATQGLEGEM